VISISRLKEEAGGLAVFDTGGRPLDLELPPGIVSPALLVAPVTDAVKRVDGGRIESLDRDRMWSVQAFVIDARLLAQLGDRELSAEGLMETVKELGYTWQVNPVSGP
jgi:hypothetical protein